MKRLIVMKFGGAAVNDASGFTRCAQIVRSRPDITPVVVVSAMAGVTNELSGTIDKVQQDPASAPEFVEKLRGKHVDVLEECVTDENIRESCRGDIEEVLAALQRALREIADTGEAIPETTDAAVVTGERLSARILAAVLNQIGCQARARDANDIGIMTDGVFGAANPLLEDIANNLKNTLCPMIKRGEIAVITGYFGCDSEARPTTFGRGGSDFSAAIVAHALKADEIEVWKDVPGFMSADPKSVPDAKHIDQMGYEEAAELSYFGAKILHPRTVEPAMDGDIPVRVKSFDDPEAPGTLILATADDAGTVRSIASRSGLAIITLYGPAMAYTPGLASDLFGALSGAGINVYTIGASMASFSMVMEESDADKAVELFRKLHESVVHDISVRSSVSLICAAGAGMRKHADVVGRIFKAVSESGVNILLAADGGSPVAVILAVSDTDCPKAIKALHQEFCE